MTVSPGSDRVAADPATRRSNDADLAADVRTTKSTDTPTAPPSTLTEPLELGPDTLSPREFYLLLTALVVPRPVGWISTVSAAGVRNVAPYSYFNLMGSEPFYCAFGSTGEKDSLKNIREVPEFVANIATMDLLEKMSFTSGDFPRDQDEFAWAGLTPVPSVKVRPERVGEAKAHLECEVKHIYEDGRTHIVIAKIVHVHVSPSVWKNGRVDPKLLDPVGRLSGSMYASLGDLYSVARPDMKQVQGPPSPDVMPRATRR
ncbi:MAG: flavin reductase family protein [Proteobacteria bacterium]|nr:flavin reductase family protein [Burkholderiales bacterium]